MYLPRRMFLLECAHFLSTFFANIRTLVLACSRLQAPILSRISVPISSYFPTDFCVRNFPLEFVTPAGSLFPHVCICTCTFSFLILNTCVSLVALVPMLTQPVSPQFKSPIPVGFIPLQCGYFHLQSLSVLTRAISHRIY